MYCCGDPVKCNAAHDHRYSAKAKEDIGTGPGCWKYKLSDEDVPCHVPAFHNFVNSGIRNVELLVTLGPEITKRKSY